MTSRAPTYNLQRQLAPEGRAITAFLFHHLTADADLSPRLVSRVLRPAASLGACIIHHAEITRLHSYLLKHGRSLPSSDMDEISQSLIEGLGDTAQQPTEATIFPLDTPHKDRNVERSLLICIGQQVLSERGNAINLIRQEYELESFPGHIWDRDANIVSVNIARSDRDVRLAVLRKAVQVLEEHRDQLPVTLTLEKVSAETKY